MVHEGTIVRYDPSVPEYARGGSLETALVSSVARWATRAELFSIVVRSAVQAAGAISYEVQVARRTRRIELDAALVDVRHRVAYELGQGANRLIQGANSTITDPELRHTFQSQVRRSYRNTVQSWLGTY